MQLDDPPDERGEAPIQLGALDRSGLLSLSTLDDDAPKAPPPSAPASGIGDLVAATQAPTRPVRPPDTSVDPFGPPRAEIDDVLVDLADDELEWTRKRMTAPPGSPPEPGLALAPPKQSPGPGKNSSPSPYLAAESSAMTTPARPSSLPASPSSPPPSPSPPTSPVLAPTPRRAPKVTPRIRLATQAYVVRSPRARIAAGVVLAIILGFVPAHIVAAQREEQAFRPIDARVIAAQAAVDSQASYDALDGFRADQLDAKRSARNSIALVSLLIWGAVGGAIAYVWFRRVPWQRFGG